MEVMNKSWRGLIIWSVAGRHALPGLPCHVPTPAMFDAQLARGLGGARRHRRSTFSRNDRKQTQHTIFQLLALHGMDGHMMTAYGIEGL